VYRKRTKEQKRTFQRGSLSPIISGVCNARPNKNSDNVNYLSVLESGRSSPDDGADSLLQGDCYESEYHC